MPASGVPLHVNVPQPIRCFLQARGLSHLIGTLCSMISIELTEKQAALLLDTVKRNHRAIADPMDARRFTLSMIEDTLIQAMKEYYRD